MSQAAPPPPPSSSQEQQPPSLDLPKRRDTLLTVSLAEALRLAVRNNPATVQSAGTIETSRASQRATVGAYLPSLGIASTGTAGTMSAGANATSNGIAIPNAPRIQGNVYGTGISSSVPLFTGGRRGADRRYANEQRAAAEAADVATRYDVLLDTKVSYFEVLRTAELMAVAQARVDQAKVGLHDAQVRLRAGTTTRSDVLRAQVALADAMNALATATTRHNNAEFALGRAIGADHAVNAQPLEQLDPTPLSMGHDELIKAVVTQAPSVRSANASSRAADAAIGSAKAQYLPTVTGTGGYSWLNQQRTLNVPGSSGWSVQVGVAYPLFNGFQREANLTRAQVQADAARAISNDAARAARSNAESALGNVSLAAQRIALASDAVGAAEEDLRVQQARYRAGASTFLDEVTSQVNLAQAQTNLVDARYDYQIARAQLDAIAGREL